MKAVEPTWGPMGSVPEKGLDNTKRPWPGLTPDVPIDGESVLHTISPLGFAGRSRRQLTESRVAIDSAAHPADRFGVTVDGVDLLDAQVDVFDHDGLVGPALHVVLHDFGSQHIARSEERRVGKECRL